jgi:hypothetical protein
VFARILKRQDCPAKSEIAERLLGVIFSLKDAPISEIAEKAGVGRTTAAKLLSYFTERGVVVKAGKGSSTYEGGKRPELYSPNFNCGYIMSVLIEREALRIVMYNLGGDAVDVCKIACEAGCSVSSIAENIFFSANLICEKNEIDRSSILSIQMIYDILPDLKIDKRVLGELICEKFGGDISLDFYSSSKAHAAAHSSLLSPFGKVLVIDLCADGCVAEYQLGAVGESGAVGSGNAVDSSFSLGADCTFRAIDWRGYLLLLEDGGVSITLGELLRQKEQEYSQCDPRFWQETAPHLAVCIHNISRICGAGAAMILVDSEDVAPALSELLTDACSSFAKDGGESVKIFLRRRNFGDDMQRSIILSNDAMRH